MSISNESEQLIRKPVPFWRKPPQVEFRPLFEALSKVAINAFSREWKDLAESVVDASAAIGLAQTTAEIGWLLVYRSLIQAMLSLLEENRANFYETPIEEDLKLLYSELENTLVNQASSINEDFFVNPKSLPILATIKTAFGDWLRYFITNEVEVQTICDRLPTYFVFALHQEWAEHPDKYACLIAEVDTPFLKATERERSWMRYTAWLQKQIAEPIFDETFGLEKVYIPLQAYYKIPIKPQKDSYSYRQREEEKFEQVVVDLKAELEAWLTKPVAKDAVRVISGDPGSGKSSFAKVFAAEQAAKGEVQVLFIPLHRFEVETNLIDAVGKFVKTNNFLQHNPLEDNHESRLLIIFDGLDELAMQGKLGAEVAKQFILKVERELSNLNQQKTRLQVLITGRELTVQANTNMFDNSHQEVLHLLPYFVPEDEQYEYRDENKLLEADQRKSWWQKYLTAKGKQYTDLPQAFNQGKLQEITAQPLLNYLFALSYDLDQVYFSEESNLNTIYANLLKAVYARRWGDRESHPVVEDFNIKDDEEFALVLEEIALACWHGNGRTTTVGEIEKKCGSNSHIKQLFAEYQGAAEAGVTRLLTAFYFRQSGVREQEKTFEFTHKSFGEYLTARRIVQELIWIHKQLDKRQTDRYHRDGWDETEALRNWAILCGSSPIDNYLFDFICDEISLQDVADVEHWQKTLCHLIGYMLRHGMPMELLPEIKSFHQANQQARNAEEALLVVLNACARVTEKISQIEWPAPEAFGSWISRLQGQRVSIYADVLCLECLSFLDLKDCILIIKDFSGANLEGANLERTNLYGAYLQETNFQGANLEGAYLELVYFDGTNLYGANLQGTYLVGANLDGVDFERANLQGANLQGEYLQGADLQGANLQGANLRGADLQGANLQGANLEGANLQEAKLEGANLQEAKLEGAILPADFKDKLS